ncbi:hypothetical protein JXB12_05280 [candidate division KSB1 bacterium]|nr:hypothetical protein [candidate division KSB1 bacterium]
MKNDQYTVMNRKKTKERGDIKMSHQISRLGVNTARYLFIIFLMLGYMPLYGQDSGYVWVESFEPGSANLEDATIDDKALEFVDELMKRDDIDVEFLGASDELQWRQANGVKRLSSAWDEGKKLERASELRKRYNRGEIGTTDESVRGVKVIWYPKKENLVLNSKFDKLNSVTDSLKKELMALDNAKSRQIRALRDSLINQDAAANMTTYAEISTNAFNWEIESGLFYWTGGGHYDLMSPYVGLALKRQNWGIEFQGGFSPWSHSYIDGNRGDAFLMGTFNILPREWYDFSVGLFSGWEFFTSSDNWTMKVIGMTAGPNIHFKFVNLYVGYNLGSVSTLRETGNWVHGLSTTISFNFKLNRW